MRWSDATWHGESTVSAITEHKGSLFRVTVFTSRPYAMVEIIDECGEPLFTRNGLRFHRHFWPALRAWQKEGWIQINPDRCFDWFPARAMRLGLDTVRAKYDAELKRRAKLRKNHDRLGPDVGRMMPAEKLEPCVPTLPAAPNSPRRKRFPANRGFLRREPLLSDKPAPELRDGQYKWLMRNHQARVDLWIYATTLPNDQGVTPLELASCSPAIGRTTFIRVPDNPDAVIVSIMPRHRPAPVRHFIDLTGLDFGREK